MLVKLSGNIVDQNGKFGGSCMARNHYGLYQKNISTPFNPMSTYQVSQRAQFKIISQAWDALSEDNRHAWRQMGYSVTLFNRVGDSYHPTGYHLFVSCNMNIAAMGGGLLSYPFFPPDLITFFSMQQGNLYATGIIKLNFSGAGPSSGIKYLISASKQFNSGINYMRTNFAVMGAMSDSANFFSITHAAYASRFGTSVTLGKKIFFKAKPIHVASGFAGKEILCSWIVA
jgi:hypothetical protein